MSTREQKGRKMHCVCFSLSCPVIRFIAKACVFIIHLFLSCVYFFSLSLVFLLFLCFSSMFIISLFSRVCYFCLSVMCILLFCFSPVLINFLLFLPHSECIVGNSSCRMTQRRKAEGGCKESVNCSKGTI